MSHRGVVGRIYLTTLDLNAIKTLTLNREGGPMFMVDWNGVVNALLLLVDLIASQEADMGIH